MLLPFSSKDDLRSIFTAVNSGIQGWINNIQLLKVSLADISTAFNAGKSGNGIIKGLVNGLKSINNAMSSSITEMDIANIMAYNAEIESGTTCQTAFYRTMLNSSKAAQDLVASMKGGTVATEGLTAKANASKLAVIGFRIAIVALNMAITMGLASVIQAVVTGLNNLIHASKNASEAAHEAASAAKKQSDEYNDELSTIDELINKYKELASSDTQDAGTRSEIVNIQSQITELVGQQANNLDLVNGKLDEELDKLHQIQAQEAEKAVESATSAYHTAKEDSEKAIGSDSFAFIDGYAYTGKREKELEKILSDFGYGDNVQSGGIFGNTLFVMDEFDNELNKLETAAEKAEYLQGMIDVIKKNYSEYASSDLYASLVQQVDAYNEYAKAQNDAAQNLMEAITYAQTYNNELSDITVDSADGFEEYRQKLIRLVSNSPDLSEAFNNGDITTENIESFVTEYISTLDSFSDAYDDWISKYETQTDDVATTIEEKASAIKDIYKASVSDTPDETFQVGYFDRWLSSLDENSLNLVYQISLNTDSAQYTLGEWQNALDNAQFHFEDLMVEEDTDNADSFSTQVTNYVEKIQTLQEALENYKSGDFKNEDLIELITEFPELAGESDNLGNAIVNLAKDLTGGKDALGNFSGIYAVFQDQFGRLDSEEDRQQLQDFMDTVLELGQVVGDTQFSIDIDAETEGMENLWTAIKESVSSTGLTADSISNLKARYQDLENYDASRLFEKTANGVHLNTSALRELEAEYENTKKAQIDSDLDSLVEQYNDLTEQINNASDAATTAELYAKRADIQNQIEDTAMLAAQYEGLTSAFYKWEQAQSIGEEGDMYDSLAGGLENIKELYDNGLIGTNKFRTAVQLMSNEDLSTANIDQLLAAYENGYPKMQRYFQDSSDGCLYFLNDLQKLNSEWVSMNEDGSWDINFGMGNDQEIAEALEINVESVQAIMRKLSDYGFDINLDSMYSSLDLLESEAEAANDKLKELGATDYTFNFNTTDIEYLDEQIKEAQNALDTFKNTDGTINLEADGAEEAQTVLTALLSQKQTLEAPAIMQIDTSTISEADEEIANAITLLQEFVQYSNDLEIQTALGVDTTETQQKIQDVASSLDSIPDEVKASLGLDDTDFNSALQSITNTSVDVKAGMSINEEDIASIQNTINSIEPKNIECSTNSDEILSELTGVNEYTINDKNFSVTVTDNASSTLQSINSYVRSLQSKTITITTNHVSTSNGGAAGTAHAQGTAKANGDWGTKESGTALGGELGQELIVRNGKFFTIGDNGAEFFQYKKGDIIFNANQTEEIFKKGRLTGGSPRGRLYYTGTAFSSGSGKITASGKVKTTPSGSGKSSGGSSGGSSSSQKEDEPEKIDWIEIAIDRIERAIKRLQTTAESAFKSFKKRLTATNNEISKVTKELSLQQKAYNRYIQEANSVGLSASLAQKVKDGTIDINEYDSDTAELIQEYQEWYEKALDCKDAIDELNESLSQLYKDNFDNVATQFDHEISLIEHLTNTYNNGLDLLAAKGYFASTKYYDALKQSEQSNKNKLNQELTSLINEYSTAMNSGAINKYSEAWYEMQEEINAVKEAIQECDIQIAEFEKSIQELDWEIFDYIEDRISQISSEADFFVSLMSNSDLFTDKGQLTDTGMATMGLYGVNYNTYMAQADQYAEEIKKLNQEIADDPYDTDLIARRDELLQLQQESILAAEDEKQAIVDLVEEGIEIELDALKELIDAYTDSLDSAKDLYDYQKKVAEQTAEIASIEKQLSAYKNDTSEEAKATVQKLKVELSKAQDDLEEIEYDQYISDQKKMLDALYDEYEMILNQRLDDIDALISDMIDTVNTNSSSIKQTISDQASTVGYLVTDEMREIWSNDGGTDSIITKYGDSFTSQLTTVNSVLNAISANVASMIKASDTAAESTTDATNTASASTTTNTASTASASTTTNTASTASSTSESTTSTKSSNKYNSSVKKGVAAAIWIYGGSTSGWGNDPQRKKRLTAKFGSANAKAIQDYINAHGSNGDLYKYWVKSGKSKLSQYYYSAFKTGGLADYTGMAWLDGTPTKPEMVLNPEDTANFIALKDAMRSIADGSSPLSDLFNSDEGAANILKQLAKIENPMTTSGTNIGDITYQVTIPIDHVQDYADFMNQLRKDGKFEKMIQDMTVNRLTGGSKIAKNKYQW